MIKRAAGLGKQAVKKRRTVAYRRTIYRCTEWCTVVIFSPADVQPSICNTAVPYIFGTGQTADDGGKPCSPLRCMPPADTPTAKQPANIDVVPE